MAAGKKRPIRSGKKVAGGKRRAVSSRLKQKRIVPAERRERGLPSSEVASRLGVTPATVRRWAKRGLVPATRTALGHWEFYSVAVVERSLAEAREKRAEARERERRRRAKKKLLAQKKRKKRGKVIRPRPPGKRPPRGQEYEPRPVETSQAPSVEEAARKFRLTPERLFEEILAGNVRSVMDNEGVLRIPQLDLQLRTWKGRKARRKKRRARRERYEAGVLDDSRPPKDTPAAISREDAAASIGPIMRDYVMARTQDARAAYGAEYRARKNAFREAWGVRRWREAYAQMVDDWGLDDYIADYEALRDS